MTMQNVISIPAYALGKGMRTYRRDSRNGKLRPDVVIGDPFTTSGTIQPIAFHTVDQNGKRTGTVVYSPCAEVLIATGNKGKRR